jgi:hypothetical protein
VAVLQVGYPWKIGNRESGRGSCSQTPTYDTPETTAGKQAIAGMLETERIPAATGKLSLRKGHQQEKEHKNASNSRICVKKLLKWQER